MVNVVFLFLLILLSAALGKKIFKTFKYQFATLPEELIFSVGIGLGILAYFTLVIGYLGLLYSWVSYTVLILLVIFLHREIKDIILNVKQFRKKLRASKWDTFSSALLVILAVHMLLTFIGALAPPTDWDAGVHHLAVAKLYAQNHKMLRIPYIMHSNYPELLQMLYTQGLLLWSDILANIIHWFMSVLLAAAIYSLARKHFSSRVALLSATIVYAMPVMSDLARGAKIDLGVTFYAFLAVYAFLNWTDSRENKKLWLSALMCGFAMATKHTGIIAFGLLGLGLILETAFRERSNISALLRRVVLFSLISLAGVAPMYIRSFVYTGNPVYPLFGNIFKTSSDLPSNAPSIASSGGTRFLDYLSFPWNVTMYPNNFGGWFLSVGPVYLAFIPFLLFLPKMDRKIKYLLIYSVGGLTLLFFHDLQVIRYLLPFFAPLSILVAYSIDRITIMEVLFHKVASSVLIMIFVLNLGLLVGMIHFRIPVVLGIESKDRYLARRINTYSTIEYANRHLRNSDRLLILDPRGYYCDCKYILGLPEYQLLVDYLCFENIGQMSDRLKELGISHILVNKPYIDHPASAEYKRLQELLEELERKNLKLLYSKNDVYLFQVIYRGF